MEEGLISFQKGDNSNETLCQGKIGGLEWIIIIGFTFLLFSFFYKW
jgi:hypothetical protein